MENKISNQRLQQSITDNMQKLADLSVATIRSSVENVSKNVGELSKMAGNLGVGPINLPFLKTGGSCNCCPPEHDCPPHCILELVRHAVAGERIIVPFAVKNTCGAAKRYRVGIRELKSLDGSQAPAQPILNKKDVSLQPGETEEVEMTLDLANFSAGNTYAAEIVIREKEINQNICFTLVIDGNKSVPVARPLDEKKYHLRWQSWQSHFYCEGK